MATTPKTGAKSTPPSTLGGPGWRARTVPHRDELDGEIWQACGQRSGVKKLRAVLLTWPGDALEFDEDPGAWLMMQRPDLALMRLQAQAIASAYASEGVQVHWLRPARRAPPNLIFAADLFFMTAEGAVLARMASGQRAGEERFAAHALAELGVPILATPTGTALFEGADAVWLGPDRVLVGTGRRTNAGGLASLQGVLTRQGVQTREVEVSASAQHLMGNLVPVDEGRALTVDPTPSLTRALEDWGIEALPVPPGPEVDQGRAANLVTLRPGRVLMPAGCPSTRSWLEGQGLACVEVDVSEYVKAAGALGCLSGILFRDG